MIPHIDIGGIETISRAWSQAPEIAQRELAAATFEAGLLLERETKEETPVGASGLLRQSIATREPQILGDQVIGLTGTSVAHAVPVELGTRPHFPPIQPLEDWARAKLGLSEDEAEGVAYAIARKISREGTKGAHMFQRAFDGNRDQVGRIYEAAGARIRDRLGGHDPQGGA